MFKRLKLVGAMFVLPWLLTYAVGARYVAAAPQAQAGPQTWTVMVGAEIFTEPGEKSSWHAMRFYPETITINAGDTILFKQNSGVEPHTVTFLGPDKQRPMDLIPEGPGGPDAPPRLVVNPLVAFPSEGNTYDGSKYANSGIMAQGLPTPPQYSLTFTTAGTFDYICVLHSVQLPDGSIMGMKGKVVVQDAGKALPMTPAQLAAETEAQMQADERKALAEEPAAKQAATRPGPNGTTIHHINSGYASEDGLLHYMRFGPSEVTINQGDTIEWSTLGMHNGFHTVTFGGEPEFLLFEPQPAGPPKIVLNPEFFPAGGSTYTGNGYYNSGPIVGPHDPPEAGAKSYSLTFSQPGRYEYICITHYLNGMDGTVTVNATTGAQPGMPRTGSGIELPLLVGAALAGVALMSLGIAIRRRKSGEMI
ncbi:MAG TPA: plastocyanin/azurin family copper-binding protein [Chloroflexia bacterium]|nr:plastocyanin/azurin family copper-binding protein [Chloroflexia bacterium]